MGMGSMKIIEMSAEKTREWLEIGRLCTAGAINHVRDCGAQELAAAWLAVDHAGYVEYDGMEDADKEEWWRQLREKTEALIAEALAGEGEELPALDLYRREWDHEEV